MMLLANLEAQDALIFLGGAVAGLLFWQWKERKSRAATFAEAACLRESAQREAESARREARLSANEDLLKAREELERSFSERRRELDATERRLAEREALINRQLEGLVDTERKVKAQEEELRLRAGELEKRRSELERLAAQRRDELARVAGLSPADARAALLKEVEQEALRDANALARHVLETTRAEAEEKARRIISLAIQRYASEHTFETTTATVALPGDEIKGRIIGRDGRNIRAFEAATGVTVLIDDTPGAVVLSGFDPVRREIAREAMTRLIQDGRIHPTRIEEVVQKVAEEIDEAVQRAGEEAVFRAGLAPMNTEITRLLGRLRFRMSFSQNVLDHSVEVAHLMGIMAAELGLEVAPAKRAGLLHDVGKAINHEVEGSHAVIGADFLKRHGETEEVVNGVASHHGEVESTNPLGILVSAADAISAARPGARSESMATYIKRLEDLEKIGLSFGGVEKCYAVQAGRELRVFVQPGELDDDKSFELARKITRKIEEELQYPGQIRVTVIRETRAVQYAK
jgi:ribonucrease Y